MKAKSKILDETEFYAIIIYSERKIINYYIGGKSMKICNQCQSEMIEGFDIKVDGVAYGIKITKPGIFGAKIEKPQAAICPKCGNGFNIEGI